MQMIDTLAIEIAREMPVSADEAERLRTILMITEHRATSFALHLSPEKWISLGIHMVSMIRRMQQGQSLPPIEPSIANQLNQEACSLSRQVIAEITQIVGGRAEEAEEILLAIHFQAARESESQRKEEAYGI